MSAQFTQAQITNRLQFENPWWQSDKIDSYYSRMRHRKYFELFYPLVTMREIKRAVVLMGPRRVGKTVMLYHAIQKLISEGIDASNICYLSLESPLYSGMHLEALLQLYFRTNNKKPSQETYVFFDEIQYLKDWEVHLKSLVDSYHHVKFVVSGSAAAALKLKSRESGAGRFTDFQLPALTFYEFLLLTGRDGLVTTTSVDGEEVDTVSDIATLNDAFVEYINFGGYPEVSLSKAILKDPSRYFRNDIIDKVLMRDLPSLYGISDTQELNSLFTYLAFNSGGELSLEGISQHSGVAKNTIRKYLTYLQAAFLIRIVGRIDHNAKRFKRATFFKVYLTNPSLRSALFSPIERDDEAMGNMVETAIYSQSRQADNEPVYYARWKSGEVDMVQLDPSTQKPAFCLEIKWSNKPVTNLNKLKNARQFCTKHGLSRLLVTSIDVTRIVEYSDVDVEFIPAALYCYRIGKSSLEG